MRNFVVLSSILLLLSGCSTTKYVDRYNTVEVPVRVHIDRPDRPIYTKDDTVPSYTAKLIAYVKKLETIIDEYNKGANNVTSSNTK